MSILFDVPWYRFVTIVALTWLGAAGPMPAFASERGLHVPPERLAFSFEAAHRTEAPQLSERTDARRSAHSS